MGEDTTPSTGLGEMLGIQVAVSDDMAFVSPVEPECSKVGWEISTELPVEGPC